MTAQSRDRELAHFWLLTDNERRSAIKRLSASGMGDYVVAAACGLSVEAVRRIIGERLGAENAA